MRWSKYHRFFCFLPVTPAWLLSGLLLLLPPVARGMSGQGFGDHSGLAGGKFNPSVMVMSRHFLEVKLLGGQLFFRNNMAFVPGSEYTHRGFWSNPGAALPQGRDQDEEKQGRLVATRPKANKYLHLNARITGPSVLFVHGRHAFALSEGLRTASSASQLPYEVSFMILHGHPPYPDQSYQHTEPFWLHSMSWLEWAASYAGLIVDRPGHQLAAGLSVKFNQGIHGLFYKNSQVEYADRGGSALDIHSLTADMGISLPLDYNTNSPFSPAGAIAGRGLSVDAGVTYSIPSNRFARERRRFTGQIRWGRASPCETPYVPYRFRFGVSLLDAGRIRYTKNIRYLIAEEASSTPGQSTHFHHAANIGEFIDEIGIYFTGSTDSLRADRAFSMGLPSTLSLQIDYHAGSNIFVHALGMGPVSLSQNGPSGPAYLSLAPRFENRWFELGLPLTLYRYREPLLGLSVRVWNLRLGTTSLRSLLAAGDFRGADFYISFSLGILKGNCPGVFGRPANCLE